MTIERALVLLILVIIIVILVFEVPMTRTDIKTPPANPHKHDHGLTQVDAALAGKAATMHTHPTVPHTHPDITARLDAIEKDAAVTKALLLAAIGDGSFPPPPAATVPDAPTGVTATAGNTTAAVTWTAPASNGGAGITSYVVTPYIGATAQTPVNTGTSATSKTVTGLTNGTTYTFKVAATNSVGTGSQSSASAPVTYETPPPGAAYYISPTGSDSTGLGTIGSPWRTVAKFYTSAAAAGRTLYCRGGTYTWTTTVTISGISGSSGSPITVRAYPGETPVFQGVGSGSGAKGFAQFQGGSSWWVIDGLQFANFKATGTGVIWVGDASVSTHHITVRNCRFTAMSGGTSSDQQVYLSYHADDCTVEWCVFAGAHVGGDGGTAVNVGDHEPSPRRFLIQRNIMSHFGDTGAIWVNGDISDGSILHNTFDDSAGTSVFFIRTPNYASVTVRDNAGTSNTNGVEGEIYDDGPGLTEDHNFWHQSFDSGHLLVAGQSGRSAASDGTDAGALDW